MKYQLAPLAESDLTSIFETTITEWGIEQAEKYAKELHSCFEKLATHPNLGTSRSELGSNVKSFSKGSHVIYYRFNKKKNRIEIARVLHERMDVRRHLQD